MIMKKIYLCLLLCLSLFITACGNAEGMKNDSINEKTSVEEYAFSDEIQKIEDGLSYVEYDGDYKFETFLAQNGASSDKEVIQFLTKNLFADAGNLSFAKSAFGCSTLASETGSGNHLFGRNFDWETCDALVVKSKPTDGYASIATVNLDFIRQGAGIASHFLKNELLTMAALYAPLDGMNEKGVVVSVNMISDGEVIEQTSSKPDLTTTTAVRYLLNHADSVDHAVELLGQYDMHASMGMMIHFALTDTTGKSVVVEYINNEMSVIDTKVVTNFYLTKGDKYGIGTEQSHERYDILTEKEKTGVTDVEQMRDALDRVSKDNFADSSTTEWSIVFELEKLKATYYHRENYTKGYGFSLK